MLKTRDLCETLKRRALYTHKLIGQGLSSGLGVLEETITDVNLLEIETAHDGYVYTKKFSKRQEGAESGADWLWCIGQPGSWLNLLVQAKIVSPFTGTCRYLDYRGGGGRQRSLLLKFARMTKSVPLYVVYCHIPKGYEPPSKARPQFASRDPWEWGCSWITPRRVRQLSQNNRRKLEDLLSYGIPWAYPFCQLGVSDRVPLGKAIADGLARGQEELSDHYLVPVLTAARHKDLGKANRKIRIQWESVDPTQLVQERFPRVVKRLLSLRPDTRPPIAGLSVISAIPFETFTETRFLTRQEKERSFYLPRELDTRSNAMDAIGLDIKNRQKP